MQNVNQSQLPEIPTAPTSEQEPLRMELEALRTTLDQRLKAVETLLPRNRSRSSAPPSSSTASNWARSSPFMEETLKSRMTIFL